MSGNLEQANGGRRSDFPAEWGEPEGSTYSAKREAWVRTRVALHQRSKRSASAALSRVRELLDRGTP